MKYYANLGGNSNVVSYEYGDTSITVQFSSGVPYTYSYESAGMANVETMKKLADVGQGLNAFIKRNVNNLYVK
ncbi:MAG: hypothetical protein LBL34_05790 [Clostridiales bacterium]|jgi:hypothetical protein|nr:hypothetical protein [Clostridiales bacterium]